jgi:hypothetical protein
VTLAIFDLDNTLIAGDSDHLGASSCADHGLVDGDSSARENDRFYADYQRGELDIDAYLRVRARAPGGPQPRRHRHRCRRRIVEECIEPDHAARRRCLLAAPGAGAPAADHHRDQRVRHAPHRRRWGSMTCSAVPSRSSTAVLTGAPVGT